VSTSTRASRHGELQFEFDPMDAIAVRESEERK